MSLVAYSKVQSITIATDLLHRIRSIPVGNIEYGELIFLLSIERKITNDQAISTRELNDLSNIVERLIT